MTELVFVKDKEWSVIDAELCRVKRFGPLATVENGNVRALDRSVPYAAVEFECEALPQDATGYITHRLDFLHLWSAFNERGVAEDEEVIFFWTKKNLKSYARFVSRFMPRLWVMVCPKEAFELMTDLNFKPELDGLERWKAQEALVEWKPEVMT
jgi:hypothetical protein